jgi:hypothetical protein
MDKIIKRYESVNAMKADEYAAWQLVPPCERILTLALYGLAGKRNVVSSL